MTSLDDLPIAQLLCPRLSLQSVASLCQASKTVRTAIDLSDGHWLDRVRLQFGELPGDAAARAGAPGKETMKRATQSAARLLTEHPAIASYARAYNTAAPGAACVTLAAKSHDVRSSGRGDDWDAPRAAAAIDSQVRGCLCYRPWSHLLRCRDLQARRGGPHPGRPPGPLVQPTHARANAHAAPFFPSPARPPTSSGSPAPAVGRGASRASPATRPGSTACWKWHPEGARWQLGPGIGGTVTGIAALQLLLAFPFHLLTHLLTRLLTPSPPGMRAARGTAPLSCGPLGRAPARLRAPPPRARRLWPRQPRSRRHPLFARCAATATRYPRCWRCRRRRRLQRRPRPRTAAPGRARAAAAARSRARRRCCALPVWTGPSACGALRRCWGPVAAAAAPPPRAGARARSWRS